MKYEAKKEEEFIWKLALANAKWDVRDAWITYILCLCVTGFCLLMIAIHSSVDGEWTIEWVVCTSSSLFCFSFHVDFNAFLFYTMHIEDIRYLLHLTRLVAGFIFSAFFSPVTFNIANHTIWNAIHSFLKYNFKSVSFGISLLYTWICMN